MKYKLTNVLFIFFLILILSNNVYAISPGRAIQKENYFIYIIKPGDTLYRLTQKFKIRLSEIQKLNPYLTPDSIHPGDTIKITINPDLKYYIVKPGDTLWKISKKFNYPLTQLINRNQLKNPGILLPDEVIILPEKYKRVRTVLYFLKYTEKHATLVPEERQIPVKNNFYKSVVNELIKGPLYNENLFIPVPKTTVIRALQVKNNIAYVNFSTDIQRANVGSTGEALLLNAITNTLTEFKEIKGVKILIEGQTTGSIGGHIGLDHIFRRNLGMVSYD